MKTKVIAAVIIGVMALLYAGHFAVVVSNAVNVPYFDEWEVFNKPDLLDGKATLPWLFAPHNEHRIVTTKALIFFLYRLDGWNHVVHQAVNFLVFGILLAMIVRIVSRSAPSLGIAGAAAFTLFLLSPINFANHAWGFQTQMHVSILAAFAAAALLFRSANRHDIIGGAILLITAIYSMAIGLAIGVTVAACFCLRELALSRVQATRARLARVLGVSIAVGGALLLWFGDYLNPALATPWHAQFWRYLGALVSGGFGVRPPMPAAGALLVIVILAPIVVLVFTGRVVSDGRAAAITAMLAGTFVALATIAAGRARIGVEQAITSRYSEVVMLLVPLTAAAWAMALDRYPAARRGAVAGLWIVVFVMFLPTWLLFSEYARIRESRLAGLRCVEGYIEMRTPAQCDDLYGPRLDTRIDVARQLGASFTRPFEPREGSK